MGPGEWATGSRHKQEECPSLPTTGESGHGVGGQKKENVCGRQTVAPSSTSSSLSDRERMAEKDNGRWACDIRSSALLSVLDHCIQKWRKGRTKFAPLFDLSSQTDRKRRRIEEYRHFRLNDSPLWEEKRKEDRKKYKSTVEKERLSRKLKKSCRQTGEQKKVGRQKSGQQILHVQWVVRSHVDVPLFALD